MSGQDGLVRRGEVLQDGQHGDRLEPAAVGEDAGEESVEGDAFRESPLHDEVGGREDGTEGEAA